MTENAGAVHYEEAETIGVGKLLSSKGYAPASFIGAAMRSLREDTACGILYQDPDVKPRKHFFGLIVDKPRRLFIGRVWFRNDARGANKQNWVFEVFGRKYVELLKPLAEEMAATFKVKINFKLVRELPYQEWDVSSF